MVSFTHRVFLLILGSSFCHKLSLFCYSTEPFRMHLWFTVLSSSSSWWLLGFSRYSPLCTLSKGKTNSACWGISWALHREGSSPMQCVLAWPGLQWARMPKSVSTCADQQRQEQNKTREVTHTSAQRDKGGRRERQERGMNTTWGHRGHVSQGIK